MSYASKDGAAPPPGRSIRGRVAVACLLSALAVAADCSCEPPAVPADTTQCWQHAGLPSNTCCEDLSEREPNDNTRRANPVADAGCGEANAQTLTGSLGGDVDVFRTFGARCSGSQPSATLTTTDSPMRLCLFASCWQGKTSLAGCSAGVPTHLPEGQLGCCTSPAPADGGASTGTSQTSQVSLDVDCDADVQFGALTPIGEKPPLVGYLVVDEYLIVDGGAPPCSSYQISYHY
jgi:hypothetical protein